MAQTSLKLYINRLRRQSRPGGFVRLNIKDVNVDVLPQHQSAGKGTLLLVARLLERFEAGGRGTKVIGWDRVPLRQSPPNPS